MRLTFASLVVAFLLAAIPGWAQTSAEITGQGATGAANTKGATTSSGLVAEEDAETCTARHFTRVTSEYFSRGAAISIADDTPWTMSVWMLSDDAIFANFPAIFHNSVNNSSLYLDNKGSLRLTGTTGGFVSESVTGLDSTTTTWYHLVVKADGTNLTNICYYANTAKDATCDTLVDSAITISYLGRVFASYHNGRLAYFSVWDGTALSDAQVVTDYGAGLGVACASKAPVPDYCLDLDEESGIPDEDIGGGAWADNNTVGSADGPCVP